MDPTDILSLDPGAFASGNQNGDGSLPDDSGSLANLSANFTPSLDNLLPTTTTIMPTSLTDMSSLFSSGTSTSLDPLSSSLLGFGENLGSSLLGAFVTNPQNAATAEQQQLQTAQINAATSSQIFGYLLIGLVIFLIFGAFEK